MSADEPDRVARLVHDLRTPLAVIRGFADLLGGEGSESLTPVQRRDYAQRIAEAADLLAELLDGAQARAGRGGAGDDPAGA